MLAPRSLLTVLSPPLNDTWRRLALGLLLFSTAGVALELLLLEHFDGVWQWTPLALLSAGAFMGASLAWRPTRAVVHALQALMLMYLLAGACGLYFHLNANLEFELELRPSIGGVQLLVETLKGAMPALAPGAMVQIGLLGLLVCFRHPSLTTARPGAEESRTLEI